jgi:hypothetical protein
MNNPLGAVIAAAREVEAAIDAWGKTDVSDPAEAEKEAVMKTGHTLYLALLEYDRLYDRLLVKHEAVKWQEQVNK